MNTKYILLLVALILIGIVAYVYILKSREVVVEPYSAREVSPDAKPSDYSDHTLPVAPPDETNPY